MYHLPSLRSMPLSCLWQCHVLSSRPILASTTSINFQAFNFSPKVCWRYRFFLYIQVS
jgi:hypothetical protein